MWRAGVTAKPATVAQQGFVDRVLNCPVGLQVRRQVFFLFPLRIFDETYVSTQPEPAAENPRVPGSDAHQERPHRVEAPARQGAQAPHCLV
jgi:hypothetical protein